MKLSIPTSDAMSSAPPPDGCPVHHLDPGATVVLIEGSHRHPYSAGLICQTWHQIAPMREAFTRALARTVERAELRGGDR